MIVRVVCPGCANRYAGVVWSDCPNCLGFGFLAVTVPPNTSPWVAARAVTLDGVKRVEQVAAGLLREQVHAASGISEADLSGERDRMAAGAAAGRLLLALGLRVPHKRKPVVRRSKAEVEADRASKAASALRMDTEMETYRQRRHRREQEERAAAAVLEDYAALHPEEYQERRETALAMVALGDLPDVRIRGWCAGA